MSNKIVEGLKNILAALEANVESISGDSRIDTRQEIKRVIKAHEISDSFGIDIVFRSFESGDTWVKLSDREFIGKYGKQYNRTISWSDDGRQPNDEWLYMISFPTGAYFFHSDYPTHTFESFWDDLKALSPAYCDTNNSSIYWTSDNAKAAHEVLPLLIEKYRPMAFIEVKKAKADKLREEIEKLEGKENE